MAEKKTNNNADNEIFELSKVQPIILTDNDTGKQYVLEFDLASVKFAEQRGFDIDNLKGVSGLEDLFYYSFRKHHKSMSQIQTNDILYKKMGGFPDGMIERLGQLYTKPYEALVQREDDDEAKNVSMTVQM